MSTSSAHEEVLADVRGGAFALAYRMLGSVAEAEDVVQEALLRLHGALEGGEDVRSPRAYAATLTTRLAIDQLRSARRTREQYVGDWLPEPLLTDGGAEDPAEAAELADSLSVAFLVLLEQLSPRQRAALLLHDVFGYGYDEVAAIIGSTEAAARQLTSRARRQVDEGRPRFDASREQRDELAHRFFAAAREGDMQALEALLAEDVVLQGDGGGKVPALARALHGRARVARTIAAWGRHGARTGATLTAAEVNGQPGAVLREADGEILGAMTVEVAGGAVVGDPLGGEPREARPPARPLRPRGRLGGLDRVLDDAEPLDLAAHDVARRQVLRRVERHADAVRRAREDDVARLERDRLGQEVDDRPRAEDQVATCWSPGAARR